MIGDLGRGRGRADLWFWLFVLGGQLFIALVAYKSPVLAIALAGAVGVLALLALVVGTRGGTLLIAGFLVAVTVCLPGDIALQYRLPIGGGGIFIVDFILALLLGSLALYALTHPDLRPIASPVRLPFLLFLLWVVAAALVGFLRGNEFKLILQDARALSYYVLFFCRHPPRQRSPAWYWRSCGCSPSACLWSSPSGPCTPHWARACSSSMSSPASAAFRPRTTCFSWARS